MDRITDKNLQAVIDRINRMTGSPASYWVTPEPETGRATAIGHYCLSRAYGGVSLQRVMNTGGGVKDVLSCGHVPKRHLYKLMHAWICGYNAAKGD